MRDEIVVASGWNFRGLRRLRPGLAATLLLVAVPLAGGPVLAQQATEPPPHIQTALTFLLAWGHERWDELGTVAADQVTVRIGDETFSLEPAMQRSDVTLVFPFRGLSTVRVGDEVKGIAIEELGLKVGEDETRGPGTITLQVEDGRFRVVAVSAAPPGPSTR